ISCGPPDHHDPRPCRGCDRSVWRCRRQTAAARAGRRRHRRPDRPRTAGVPRLRPPDPPAPGTARAGVAIVMKIAIGSDHRGWEVKRRLVVLLQQEGHQVLDLGPEGRDSVDYPDFAFRVAEAVSKGEVERGILICGTGIGMTIAANK